MTVSQLPTIWNTKIENWKFQAWKQGGHLPPSRRVNLQDAACFQLRCFGGAFNTLSLSFVCVFVYVFVISVCLSLCLCHLCVSFVCVFVICVCLCNLCVSLSLSLSLSTSKMQPASSCAALEVLLPKKLLWNLFLHSETIFWRKINIQLF